MGVRVEIGFKLRSTCFDSMMDYQLSQMLELLGNSEFNYLTFILTQLKT